MAQHQPCCRAAAAGWLQQPAHRVKAVCTCGTAGVKYTASQGMSCIPADVCAFVCVFGATPHLLYMPTAKRPDTGPDTTTIHASAVCRRCVRATLCTYLMCWGRLTCTAAQCCPQGASQAAAATRASASALLLAPAPGQAARPHLQQTQQQTSWL